MNRIVRIVLAFSLVAGSCGLAAAQDTQLSTSMKKMKAAKTTPASKPSGEARRPGELEGWNTTGKPAAKPIDRPADAVGVKPATADGGLPLPRREVRDPAAPIGIDPKGNIGPALKF